MKKLIELLLIITIPIALIALYMHHREGGCHGSCKKDKKAGRKKHHLW